MKDEILSYWDMCSREGMALQRGMYFRSPPAIGVILMSRRKNAPYTDDLNDDGTILLYEGHDVPRTKDNPNPKELDQSRFYGEGRLTQNGLFAESVDDFKTFKHPPAIFRVYEKMKPGIWTERGLYELRDYDLKPDGSRKVFKFLLKQTTYEIDSPNNIYTGYGSQSRQIPSWIKQFVFKRDKGRCVICGANDQLHFDHDFPYSLGGTSIIPENVRILCARHNLQKSAKIE